MKDKHKKQTSVTDIGQELVEYSRGESMATKRGLVVELFPFIYEASTRMSARAISRFLQEKHGVRLSAVTITKALADPQKYWNDYFDIIVPFAKTFERGSYHASMLVFLFDDKKFEDMTKALPIRAFQGHWLDLKALRSIKVADEEAGNILRDKWFRIPLSTRLQAKRFLLAQFGGPHFLHLEDGKESKQ